MADTPKEEFRKLMRAYAGFQMATALVVASKFGDVCWAGTIVSLFAISIPSTLAYPSFVRLTQEGEKQNPAHLMATCFSLAFFPSVAAISLMLAPVSIFAAIVFPVTSLAWCIVVVRLRKHNSVNVSIEPPKENDK